MHNHGFTKSFTEHCVLIGLVSVQADLTYQQGLDRMWSRQTRFDFYWPALSHIGEQAVLNKEIFYQNAAADNLVFGYQERYAEYRYKPSKITGLFRSGASGTNNINTGRFRARRGRRTGSTSTRQNRIQTSSTQVLNFPLMSGTGHTLLKVHLLLSLLRRKRTRLTTTIQVSYW